MADAVSVTSGLISLAGIALQASTSLHETLKKSKSRKKIVCELRYELESLSDTLQVLSRVVVGKEAQLTVLTLPLQRLGIMCTEFGRIISENVPPEESQRSSFNWAKLFYMGGDITDLRNNLATYRATIDLSIGSATVQQFDVTDEVLEEYKQIIFGMTFDLEDRLKRLRQISERLQQSIDLEKKTSKEPDFRILRDFEEEMQSIQQCLSICAQVSKAVEISRSQLPEKNAYENLALNLTRTEKETRDFLADFRNRLSSKSSVFRQHLTELDSRSKTIVEQQQLGKETADIGSVKGKSGDIVKCLHSSADAFELAYKSNVFEDCIIGNYSDKAMSANRISTEDNEVSAQLHGQLSDKSIQRVLRDRGFAIPNDQILEAERRVLGQVYPHSAPSMSDAGSINQSQDELTQGTESSSAITTLPGSYDQHTLELKPSSWLDQKSLDSLQDEDCVSVVSDDNGIASQVAMIRTQPENFVIRHIASFLCEREELRPLHKKALKGLGTTRFQHGYRQILKSYVMRLNNEARTAVQNDIVRVLKPPSNRINVAQRIIALIQEENDGTTKPLDSINSQPVEKQTVEEWERYAHGLLVADPVVNSDCGEYEQSSGRSDSEAAQDEHRAEELLFPNIANVNRFLYRGIPFQTLLLELRLLILPSSLREITESIPKHLIHISPVNDRSLINMVKAWIEDHTAFEWDWWPLMPRVPHLPSGRLRLQWRFCGHTLYKEISPEDSLAIQQILVLTGDHPPKCFCCEEKKSGTEANRMNWTRLHQSTRKSLADLLSWKAPSSSLTSQTSQPIAHQRYTPTSTASTSTASTAHDSAATRPSYNSRSRSAISARARPGSMDTLSTSGHSEPLWVVFGIKDLQYYDKIENIRASNLLNDMTFFMELKKRYAKHRWLLQRWFSPFRFRYCKFVQFELINFDQVYCVGEALPDELGYTSDYEYRPRPPKAKNPLINKRLFSICLQACDPGCYLALLPSFLHRCRHLPYSSHNWERIPRKKGGAFNTSFSQPGEIAFGMEASYTLSAGMVFFYHVLLISSAFSFWIYWLNKHPEDLQNASVPTFTVLAVMGTFWAILGRRTTIP